MQGWGMNSVLNLFIELTLEPFFAFVQSILEEYTIEKVIYCKKRCLNYCEYKKKPYLCTAIERESE